MFINKLNQVFKPKRVLYYTDTDEDNIRYFKKGIIPEKVGRYDDAYGSYDRPGLFYIRGFKKPVIGIEYRPDDDRVTYPDDLKKTELGESYFCSVEIDDDTEISREMIEELFNKVAADDDAHRVYSDLTIMKDPAVIGVFTGYKKIRILYEWKLVQNRAKEIIKGRLEETPIETLCRLAYFDPITGHYNWNHLEAFLEMPVDAGINDYTFVHFDIKEFRIINEVYGHITANKALSNVVKAMNNVDFVYASGRCHDDNFAMMMKDMPANETREKLEEFFESISALEDDPNYRIYYRAGVVPMRQAILNGNRVADAAKMAQAMGNTPNRTDITIYSDRMHDDLSWGNFIKAYLEKAIKNDEFIVYLQPKVDVKKDKVCGAEALIRWNYKGRDFLSPGKFIPFFEKNGSIEKIDDIVLEKVSKTMARWINEGRDPIPVSVNLSRSRLNDVNLTDKLTEIVDRSGIPHELIDFELTESAAYDNKDRLISVIKDLRSRGFKISMDDFGTGYSSLSLLTQMPLDILKIDKSFVDKIGVEGEKDSDLTVVRHIVALAKELGFECLAEGAEKEEQVRRLSELGCNKIQGFYYGKPMSIEDFEEKYH